MKLDKFEHTILDGHNKLAKMVNDVVLPNMNNLHTQIKNLNSVFARHVVIMHILQERSGGISNEQFEETKKHLFDVTQKDAIASRIQPKEAGSVEDRGGHGQPGVLDAAGGGSDDGSSRDSEDGEGDAGIQLDESGEGSGTPDPEPAVAGAVEDETA